MTFSVSQRTSEISQPNRLRETHWRGPSSSNSQGPVNNFGFWEISTNKTHLYVTLTGFWEPRSSKMRWSSGQAITYLFQIHFTTSIYKSEQSHFQSGFTSSIMISTCVLEKQICGSLSSRWVGFRPLFERGRSTAVLERPKTVATYLMLGLVDTIFVHTINKPLCPCRVKRGHDWPASVLFRRGRAVSNDQRGRMGKMTPPHVLTCGYWLNILDVELTSACQRSTSVITCFPDIVIVHDSRTCLTSCRVAPATETVHAHSEHWHTYCRHTFKVCVS